MNENLENEERNRWLRKSIILNRHRFGILDIFRFLCWLDVLKNTMPHESVSVMRRRLLGVLWAPLTLVTMTFAVLCCMHAHNAADLEKYVAGPTLYAWSLPAILQPSLLCFS